MTYCVYTRAHLDPTTLLYGRVHVVRPPFSAAGGAPAGVLAHTRMRALLPLSDYKARSRPECAQLMWRPDAAAPYGAHETADVIALLTSNGFVADAALAAILANADANHESGERLLVAGDFAP